MSRAPFQVHVIPFRKKENFEYAIFRRADAGYWQGIAGGGEDNESPIEAAKRETSEEANIPASETYFLLKTISSEPVYHFTARNLWPNNQYVIPGYYFAVEASNIEIALSYEHLEYKWVNYDDGRKLLNWEDDKTALWELNERLLNDDLPPAA